MYPEPSSSPKSKRSRGSEFAPAIFVAFSVSKLMLRIAELSESAIKKLTTPERGPAVMPEGCAQVEFLGFELAFPSAPLPLKT